MANSTSTSNPVFLNSDHGHLTSEDEEESFYFPPKTDDYNEKTPFFDQYERKDEAISTSFFLYFLVVFAAIGGFLFGYDTGVISGAMIPIKRRFHLSYEYQEIIVSITLAGAIVGAASSAYFNSKIGRRGVLFIASLSFTLGSIVMGAAINVSMIITGRLIVGLGIGYASMTVPIYIAEAAPVKIRGTLVTMNQLLITFGIFMASLLNSLFSYVKGDVGWRFMLGVGAIPALIMLIGVFFLPESPRWLISKGENIKAKDVLKRLRGTSNVDSEFEQIVSAVADSTKVSFKGNLKQCLTSPNVRRAILLGCSLQAFQQLSAINTVMYYSATIIEMSGIENETEILWFVTVVAGGNFVVTVFAMFIIEKIQRRKLLLFSLFGAAIGLLLLATTFILTYKDSLRVTFSLPNGGKCGAYDRCFTCVEDSKCGFCFQSSTGEYLKGSCMPINTTKGGNPSNPEICSSQAYNISIGSETIHWSSTTCPSSMAWLAIASMVLYLAMFAIGVGPLPWTINAEMYPLWARNIGQAAATSTNWFFNLLISLTFLNMIELLTKSGVFIFYSVITLFGCVYFYLLLHETKGVQMESVELLYDGSWWVPWKRI